RPTRLDWSGGGIPGTNGSDFPTIAFTDGGAGGGYSESTIGPPYKDRYAPYNVVASDTVSWAGGRHMLKFGGDVQARGMNAVYLRGMRAYNFTSQTLAPNNNQVWRSAGFAFANSILRAVAD